MIKLTSYGFVTGKRSKQRDRKKKTNLRCVWNYAILDTDVNEDPLELTAKFMEPLDINLEPEHPTWQMFCRTIKAYSPTDVISMAKSGEYDLEGYWWYKEDRKPLKFEVVERENNPPDPLLGSRAIIHFEE